MKMSYYPNLIRKSLPTLFPTTNPTEESRFRKSPPQVNTLSTNSRGSFKPMSSTLLKWAKGLTTLAIILVSLFLFYQFREDFYLISNITPALFITLSFLAILSITINGNKLRLITQSFKIELNFNEWVGLSFITSSLNGFVYKSGSLVTSNYLKRKHKFPYTSFLGSLGADHLMMILINACVGLVSSIYAMTLSDNIFPFTLLFLAMVIAILYLVRNPFGFFKSENRYLDAIFQAAGTLNSILRNKLLFRKLLFNNLFLANVMGVRVCIACKAMGIYFEIFHCYLFTTVSAFVRLIPMLQSDIGSRELTVGFLSESLGSGFKQGILATAVDRVFEMALALIGMAVFRNLIISPISNNIPDKF